MTYLSVNAAVSILVHPVYSIITWKAPGSAIFVIGIVIFMYAIYFVAAAFASVRDALAAFIHKKRLPQDCEIGGVYPLSFLDDPAVLPCSCCRRPPWCSRVASAIINYTNRHRGTSNASSSGGAPPQPPSLSLLVVTTAAADKEVTPTTATAATDVKTNQ